MSNKIKCPTQKQGNQVNSPCIPALPRVGHNIDWCIRQVKKKVGRTGVQCGSMGQKNICGFHISSFKNLGRVYVGFHFFFLLFFKLF
jgi:hypothetical protein